MHVWIIYICVLGTAYFFKRQAEGRVTVYIVSDKVLPVLTLILLASGKKNCFKEQVDAPVPYKGLK